MVKTAKQYKQVPIQIKREWCKGCGICVVICDQNVFILDQRGQTVIANPLACKGCRKCESHCPDFAINIGEEA